MIHAATGSLGSELARAHSPDLVLLDLNLPEGSGLEVLRTLRSGPTTAQIPVVIVSADASTRQVRRMLDEGATRYITKPFALDEILELLDSVSAELPRSGARQS
jgi:DNA-binding response OmpR family regulator